MLNKYILIGIAVIVVLVLVGGGVGLYFLFRKEDSGNDNGGGGNGGGTGKVTPTSYGLIDSKNNTGPTSICTTALMAEMQKEGVETVDAYNAELSALVKFIDPRTNQNLCPAICNSTTAHKLNFSDRSCTDHIFSKLSGKITNCNDLERIYIEAESGGFCKAL